MKKINLNARRVLRGNNWSHLRVSCLRSASRINVSPSSHYNYVDAHLSVRFVRGKK